MRFYTKSHQFYGGIDLHARSMDVCLVNQEGKSMRHRHMNTRPEAFRNAIAPSREEVVVAVDWLFTWSWLADLGRRAGLAFVRGHALSMKAIHGGTAKTDKVDAHQIAVLRRGGLLPYASVYPAEMRATRDLLRRRMPLPRQRAALLAHVQTTNSQYHLPESGKNLAYKANRAGVAERVPPPAVQRRIDVALALLAVYDRLLSDLALSLVKTAK
jgi:Transposase